MLPKIALKYNLKNTQGNLELEKEMVINGNQACIFIHHFITTGRHISTAVYVYQDIYKKDNVVSIISGVSFFSYNFYLAFSFITHLVNFRNTCGLFLIYLWFCSSFSYIRFNACIWFYLLTIVFIPRSLFVLFEVTLQTEWVQP